MGNLPISRTRTHVQGDPLEPALVDELQDQIILLQNQINAINTASTIIRIPASAGRPGLSTDTWDLVTGYTQPFGASVNIDLGSHWIIPFSVPDGKTITALRLHIVDNVTGPSKISFATFSQLDASSPPTRIGGADTVSSGIGATVPQTLSRASLTEVVGSSKMYFADAFQSLGSAQCSVAWLQVEYHG